MLPHTIKPLMAFILLISTLPPITATSGAASDLYISVSLTKMERSKDSNSRQTKVTVNGEKVVYERVYRGYRRNKIEPVRKEFTIKDEDVKRLEKLVRDGSLLVSDSLKYPATGAGFVFFEITLDARLSGRQSHIEITGPRKAAGIKDKRLYKNTKALLEEIFRLLNAQDEEISYEGDLVIETP